VTPASEPHAAPAPAEAPLWGAAAERLLAIPRPWVQDDNCSWLDEVYEEWLIETPAALAAQEKAMGEAAKLWNASQIANTAATMRDAGTGPSIGPSGKQWSDADGGRRAEEGSSAPPD
jgi:hypothetical protein